jgi:hypothetical protein
LLSTMARMILSSFGRNASSRIPALGQVDMAQHANSMDVTARRAYLSEIL